MEAGSARRRQAWGTAVALRLLSSLVGMALGVAAKACLLAVEAWALALAATVVAFWRLASVVYRGLLDLSGARLGHRLAQVGAGRGASTSVGQQATLGAPAAPSAPWKELGGWESKAATPAITAIT